MKDEFNEIQKFWGKKILLKVWKWRAQSNRKKSIQTENNKDGIIKMSRAGEVYVTSLITECMNQSAKE